MRPSKHFAIIFLTVLNGCQQGPALDGVTASSTAIIIADGRRIAQTNVVRCRYVGMNDGIVKIGKAPIVEGDHHWVKRDDGSIVVFPRFNACLEPSAPLDVRNNVTKEFDWWSGENARVTYVFDRADRPTKVDLYSKAAAIDKDRNPYVESVTLERSEAEVTHALAKAFPGLAGIVPDRKRMALNGTGADLISGAFVGVQATSFALAPGSNCLADARDDVVILPRGHRCGYINDCERGDEKIVCGKRKGSLRVSFNSVFSEASAVLDSADEAYSVTLYDANLPIFRNAPHLRRGDFDQWTPDLCVKGLCAPPNDSRTPTLFYFPETRELIEIGLTTQTFGPKMFSGWKGP